MKTKYFFLKYINNVPYTSYEQMKDFLKNNNVKKFIMEQGNYYFTYGNLTILYYEEL